jgi:hypothetical protein
MNKLNNAVNSQKIPGIDITNGSTSTTIKINEQNLNPYVQILFILKEASWDNDEWITFTKQELRQMIENDREIYVDNFNEAVYNNILNNVNKFCKIFCA